MNILILGNSVDAHAVHLRNALIEAGAIVEYLNTQQFPTQLSISWQPNNRLGTLTLPEGHKLNLNDIHSVFWRSIAEIQVPKLEDLQEQIIALHDSMSLLRTFLQACPARWVNSWEAYQFHKEKPLQLTKAEQIGVNIPATIVSNDPEEIKEFVLAHEKLIFKPVYGGSHTQLLTKAHLEPQRLNLALKIAPITIQEYIPGTNIRSYVIADSVYSAEIRTGALDCREDLQSQLIPIELPEAIKQQCLAITSEFMMEWTAIDWRLTPQGEYMFLEANPSPMFIYFEQQTGFPITQELVKLLMS